jgi:hypothetical protein
MVMNLQEFDTLLARHDWYYAYSDDHRVWSNGEASQEKIRQAVKLSENHLTLYNAWVNSIFEDYETRKIPLTREQRNEIRKSLGVL